MPESNLTLEEIRQIVEDALRPLMEKISEEPPVVAVFPHKLKTVAPTSPGRR